MADGERTQRTDRTLVLVTGSSRSGTSSLAGSLDKLGLHVPGPYVRPGPINPKGFFETVWVVDFHRHLLARAGVPHNDSSPWSEDRVARLWAEDERVGAELAGWLAGQTADVVVVKDNQIRLFLPLWYDVAAREGFEVVVLTSLRHPAEVVGSRDLAWGQGRDDAERVRREVANTAVWLNVALQADAAARGHRRAYLRFTDLLDDWRTTLDRALRQLGLDVPIPMGPHELDTWLEADLRHSRLTWADVAGPAALQDLAEEVWGHLGALVEDPSDAAATAALDEARAAYDLLYRESMALVAAETERAVHDATTLQKERHRARLADEETRVAELTDRVRASVPVPLPLADRLREVKRRLGR